MPQAPRGTPRSCWQPENAGDLRGAARVSGWWRESGGEAAAEHGMGGRGLGVVARGGGRWGDRLGRRRMGRDGGGRMLDRRPGGWGCQRGRRVQVRRPLGQGVPRDLACSGGNRPRRGAKGRPSTPDRTRRRRSERGAEAAASAGSGVACSRGARGCAGTAGAAGGYEPARRRCRINRCLPTTGALGEAVPPPSRHGGSNPDPCWLLCQQGGPAGGSELPSMAGKRPARPSRASVKMSKTDGMRRLCTR